MYEGIKILNGGKVVDLENLNKSDNGEHILQGVEGIKIFLEDGAKYKDDLQILEEGGDVLITLVDSQGNDVFVILRGLSEILLTNNTEVPVFEVFDGADLQASFTSIEDLQAAAAGEASSNSQTTDFDGGNPPSIGGNVGDSGGNLNGFGRIGIGDPTDPNAGFSVVFSGDTSGVVTEDFGQSGAQVLSGTIIATDPNFVILFIPQSVTTEYGTFTLLEDGSWTYDLLETNPDLQALNNTETITETFPVELGAGAGGFDFIIPINGLNDQPSVENVDLNAGIISEQEILQDEKEISEISENSGVYETDLVDVEDSEQVLFSNSDFGLANLSGNDIDNGAVLTFYLASDKIPGSDDIRVTSEALGANILASDITVVIDEVTGAFTISSEKFDNLAEGEKVTIEIDYVADDGLGFAGDLENDDITNEDSVSEPATITLVITGTNDQPILESVDASDVLENNLIGQLSNELISDDDTADTHDFVDETVNATIVSNTQTLALGDGQELDDIVSNVTVDINSDGSYTVIGDGFENLAENEVVTISFLVRVTDNTLGLNGGESAISNTVLVTIDITGTNDKPSITSIQTSNVLESNLNGQLSSLIVSDIDYNDTHDFVDETVDATILTNVVDTETTLDIVSNVKVNIDSDGSYLVSGDGIENLSAGEVVTIQFPVRITDGTSGANGGEDAIADVKLVTLTITGTNDQPEIEDVNYGQVGSEVFESSLVNENQNEDVVFTGNFSAVTDIDFNNDDPHYKVKGNSLSVSANDAGIDSNNVFIELNNPNGGGWSTSDEFKVKSEYFDGLATGESVTVTFKYKVSDWEGFGKNGDANNEPSHSTFKTVTLVVTGTNDQAVVVDDSEFPDSDVMSLELNNGNWNQAGVSIIAHNAFGEHTGLVEVGDGLGINTPGLPTNIFIFPVDHPTQLDENHALDDEALEFSFDKVYNNFELDLDNFTGSDRATYTLSLKGVEVGSGSISPSDLPLELDGTFFDNVLIKAASDADFNIFSQSDFNISSLHVENTLLQTDENVNLTIDVLNNDFDDDVTDVLIIHDHDYVGVGDSSVSIVNNKLEFDPGSDFDYLASGESVEVTFKYRVDDQEGHGLLGDALHEPSISDWATVTITVLGTNDQPLVENVVLGVDTPIYETHDEVDVIGSDDTADEPRNVILGTLVASDLDLSDTHKFHFDDMSLSMGVNEELVSVNYDENGFVGPFIEGQIDVLFDSEFVDASDIDIQRIAFYGNNTSDSDIDFRVFGDFTALSDGETATLTFKYYADDETNDPSGETNLSDPKTVSITITGTNDQPLVENVVYNTHENTLVDDDSLNENAKFTGMLDEASDEDLNNANPHYKIIDNSLEVLSNPVGITASDISVELENANLAPYDWSVSRNFEVISDKFNTLGEGESVTFSFEYKASDWEGFQTTGDVNNEASHSEIKTVTITIAGRNDQPVLESVVTSGAVSEKDLNDILSTSGAITFSDEDINDVLTLGKTYKNDLSWDGGDISTELTPSQINDLLADFNVVTNDSSAPSGSGQWTFSTDENLDFLSAGEKITFSYDIFVSDDSGESNDTSSVQTVTITINGTNDQPEVSHVVYGDAGNEVYESSLDTDGLNEDAKFSGNLSDASDDDVNNTNPHYYIYANTLAVSANAAGITASDVSVALEDAAGNGWSTTTDFNVISDKFDGLAHGETVTVTFDYKASDWEGFGELGDVDNEPSHSDIKTVTLTITGTNDQPVVEDVSYSVYESTLADNQNNEEAKFSGELSEVSDDDITNNDPHYFILDTSLQVSANDVGITASDVDIILENAAGNGWSTSKNFDVISDKFNTLGVDESVTITFTYKVSDWEGFGEFGDANNEPSHSDYKTVTLLVTGTNDQPEVQEVAYDINEALTGKTLVNGQLVASDDDFTNTNNNEITFELVDFAPIIPSTSEVVFSVGGNVFKLESTDVNVNNFTAKVTSLVVNSDGSYSIEGNFNKLETGEELTLSFQYQADDNEGILSGNPLHEQSKSNIETVSVTIVGTNDAPVLKDIISIRNIDENDPAFILDGLVNIKDVDDSHMESAMVWVSSNYQEGYDFLSIDPIYLATGVVANFDFASGVLTLTGSASKNDYEDMLESIKFEASSDNPGTTKEISWKINDGEDDSAVQKTLINIDEVNDDPEARNNHKDIKEEGLGNPMSGLLLGNLILDANEKNGKVDSDVDNDIADLSISKIKSVNEGVSDSDATPGYYEVNGTYGTLKVYANGSYEYDLQDSWPATQSLYEGQAVKDVFKYTLDDGAGGSDKAKLFINVEGTNDAPIITMNSIQTLENSNPISGIDLTSSDFSQGFNFTADIFLTGDSQTFFRQTDNGSNSFLIEFGDQNFGFNGQYIQIYIPTSQGIYKAESDVPVSLNEWKNIDITYTPGIGAVLLIDNTPVSLNLSGIDPTSMPTPIVSLVNDSSYSVGSNNNEDFNGEFKNVELSTPVDGLVYASEVLNPSGDVLAFTINENAPIGAVVSDIDATDVDFGDILTYSFVDFNGNPFVSDKFEINPTSGEITVKADLDYEVKDEYILRVKVEDLYGGSDVEIVKISITDITGIISSTNDGNPITLVNHDFNNNTSQVNVNDPSTNHGWNITGTEQGGGNVLGKFDGNQNEYISKMFDFTGYEGETVSIEFNFKTYGSWDENGNYQDYLKVDINNNNEYSDSFPSGTNETVTFDYEVPTLNSNAVNIKIYALATGNDEDWSIDNFKITAPDSEVLTFDSSNVGEIDVLSILSQANDFNGDPVPSDLDKIDITDGNHILSNISVQSVISITDTDNILKIEGDASDEIKLNMGEWKVASNDTTDINGKGIDSDNDDYVTYTNISATGGAAAETIQLLIDEDIDVKF